MREAVGIPSRFLSRCLLVTSKIIIRKTYVKELFKINDVIINLPNTQEKKKLEVTPTDKVTYRVQQHKHNVQMPSVTYMYLLFATAIGSCVPCRLVNDSPSVSPLLNTTPFTTCVNSTSVNKQAV